MNAVKQYWARIKTKLNQRIDLKVIKSKLISLWCQLSEREQRLLMFLSVFLMCSMAYLLYTSLKQSMSLHQRLLIEKKETLAWLKHAQQTFANQLKPENSRQSLSVRQGMETLSTSLKKSPLHSYAADMQQVGTNTVQIHFEQVPYQSFLKWLLEFEQQYAITIQTLSVDKTEKKGLVQLKMTILI